MIRIKRRKTHYAILMGLCLVLFAGATPVYYLFGIAVLGVWNLLRVK